MVLRTVKRKFGISAPRVAVYTQLPWYWQIAVITAIVVTVVGLSWGTFLLGKSLAFRSDATPISAQESAEQMLQRVLKENESLRGQVATLEQRIRIDAATHAHLQAQLRGLTDQTAKMKEELAFFQTLGGMGSRVAIQRFSVSRESSLGELRYRLLVVQSKQRAEHFRGRVEFVAHVVDKGKEARIVFPQPGEKAQSYVLGFKFFQRMEGVLKIPPEIAVSRVEVRVIEAGTDTPLTSQLAALG